jgi:superfamily II DNA or RNA helicase
VVTIKLTGIEGVLECSDSTVFKAICDKYTKTVPGAYYAKRATKFKGWDGKKEFISSKTGKFGIGLLPYLEADLKRAEIPYNVINNIKELPLEKVIIPTLELRDYQQKMYETFMQERRCIIQLPTAAGKTAILAYMLKTLENYHGVVFFNRRSLVEQTYTYLKKYGIDVGICMGNDYIQKPIMLCTSQSVEKILHSHLNTAKFIMFDEVHEFCKGKLTSAILKGFKNASVRVGLTATVPQEPYHKLTLVSHLGQIYNDYSASDLIKQGKLVNPKISFIKLPDSSTISDLHISYQELYNKFIVNCNKRNTLIKDLVNKIKTKNNKAKILLLVQSLNHMQKLKELLPDALTIQGNDDITARKKAIKEFQTSESAILIGTVILQTGINIPEITHFINCRGLKSDIPTIQALGRALRTHETKSEVFIYDIFNQEGILLQHSKKRLRIYKKLKFQIKIYEGS